MDKIGIDVDSFIKNYAPGLTEYCCVVVDEAGLVHECSTTHLKTIIEMSGDDDILSEIPEGKSPLFFITDRLKCVIVDCENQLYSRSLNEKQQITLSKLKTAGLIIDNLINIEKKC